MDWELPKIPEEATEKLHSMFLLQTSVVDPQVILKAVDSHPRRMNGFLTGCLLQVRPVPGLHLPITPLPSALRNFAKSR